MQGKQWISREEQWTVEIDLHKQAIDKPHVPITSKQDRDWGRVESSLPFALEIPSRDRKDEKVLGCDEVTDH